MESTADIFVPSERVRGEGSGPPIEVCEHFDEGVKYPTAQLTASMQRLTTCEITHESLRKNRITSADGVMFSDSIPGIQIFKIKHFELDTAPDSNPADCR